MIDTRLTRRFGLDHPVVSAPMARVGGGRLAAAVSRAGGLGMVGGGYCEGDWTLEQLDAAGNTPVGAGFITWRLAQRPDLLEAVLARAPRAIFLSFGDPAPFAAALRAAGVPLICQVQSLGDARAALDAGASVLAAQGREAGGHSDSRATMTLVPEVADLLAREAPDVLLLAAGGIADGRGLAAALMLGADGALCGTRFWAAEEALVPPGHHAQGLAAGGDDTVQTRSVDIARDFDWPARFRNRVIRTGFTDRWDADPEGLRADAAAKADWCAALGEGRTEVAGATVGEGIGLISGTRPAAEIVAAMAAEAEALLNGGWRRG